MGPLTDFHKIAGFRPYMLVYLNSTFTFAKQAKDNFIRRKFQCKPTDAFIQLFSGHFPLRRVVGAATSGGTNVGHDQ